MMPSQSIWMIRSSLLYLLLSVSVGTLILIHKVIAVHPFIWALLPAHYEMAIWGWVVQLAMGTAYWMFPKKLSEPRRGPGWAGWLVFGFYNFGLMLLVITTLFQTHFFVSIASRGLILSSILIFAILMWQRIVTYRHHH
ncbi:hypothetical protein [Rhodohalobacter barkolensis]|nr:hypothetical protein [Rhodohalobacter barkolensis]